MRCQEVTLLLSDLIDVRRGERPSPDSSALGHELLQLAVELHLQNCGRCFDRLRQLEQVCEVFQDYHVGERPVQDFAHFGARIRARVRSEEPGHAAVGKSPFSLHQMNEINPGKDWMLSLAYVSTFMWVALAAGSSSAIHSAAQQKTVSNLGELNENREEPLRSHDRTESMQPPELGLLRPTRVDVELL